MTYGLGIKGKDSNFGKYIILASDSKGVILDQNDKEIEISTNQYKLFHTEGRKYFLTQSGIEVLEDSPLIDIEEAKLARTSYSKKSLEKNLNNLNNVRENITKCLNNYIIGTSNFGLYKLKGKKKKLESKNPIATIGSGSPWGEDELKNQIEKFRTKNTLNMPLEQAIYSAFESQKWAQENEPKGVGGKVDLIIKSQNNFSLNYKTINLDNLYDSTIAKGISQQIAANHILKDPTTAIKMMQKASSQKEKEIIANQIALSQNPQYAAAVINNINLNTNLQKTILPAILNSENTGYMKAILNKIHPLLKDELINTIKQNEMTK